MAGKRRRRLTRNLLPLVEERVAGCNLCAGHRFQVPVEDICDTLRFTTAETRRVAGSFVCPYCEAGSGTFDTVAEWEPQEWADIRRGLRWQRTYGDRLGSLVEHLEHTPSLGTLHPAGAALVAAARRGRVTTLDEGPW
jgi:hypothetical protein